MFLAQKMTPFKLIVLTMFAWLSLATGCQKEVSEPGTVVEETTQKENDQPGGEAPQLIEYSLEIDDSENSMEFQGEVETGSSVFDILDKHAQIQSTSRGRKAFIQSINGLANSKEEKMCWIYYVNDEMAKVGCGAYELIDGDRVRWVYRDAPY